MGRGVLFLGLLAVLAGCSDPVGGSGTIAADVYVPPPAVTAQPAPAVTSTVTPSAAPSTTPGVTLGSFGGAQTPDFSPTGTATASQVGSVTGLFETDAAAHAFVALFGVPAFGACLAGEAGREWDEFVSGGIPAFTRHGYRVATATEAALMDTHARLTGGDAMHVQFLPIRTGPIVTVLSTAWRPVADPRLMLRAATNIGHRQHTA